MSERTCKTCHTLLSHRESEQCLTCQVRSELAPAQCSPAAGTWAGKCVACDTEYQELPAHDEGVCAECGCHSVEQIINRIPLRGNAELRHSADSAASQPKKTNNEH